jgi:hypothetical protein
MRSLVCRPLQVAHVDHIVVDDPQRPNPGSRQVQGGRRSKPTGADEEHPRVEQFGLTGLTHFRQQEMATVAIELLRREHPILPPGIAGRLPRAISASHRDH